MTRLAALAVLAGIAYLALVAWSFMVLGNPAPAHRRLLDHGGVG